jgi:glycosyltransferase involved in cell wall biosynthesis
VRVLVVDPQAFTPPYDHELCASLAARGHDVELLTTRFSHGDVPAPAGYRRRWTFVPPAAGLVARWPSSPLRVPLKLAGHARGLGSLVREARRDRPDVVHWQWAPLPKLDLRALRQVDRHAGVTVFTAHDVLPRRSAGQVGLWRELYASCDRVIVHSQRGRERLEREVGVEAARIAVVPHALFASLANWPHAAGDGPPTILHFGLLRPDKGLDTLVEALPAVAEAVPEVRLEVVGSPRMPLGPLKERAAALGVAGRIRWDERFVSDAELAEAFGRATVVALPYRSIENSGVLATALAFGVPPVLTDVGGFPELCGAYDLGHPVPPDAPEALAAALVAALTDEERRTAAEAGMARAREELTWERIAEQTEQVYRDALDG